MGRPSTKVRLAAKPGTTDSVPAAPAHLTRVTIAIAGMTCTACETRVGRALRGLPAVQSASVSAAKGEAVIIHSGRLDLESVRAVVKKAGYSIGQADRSWLTKNRQVWRDVALAGGVVVLLVVIAQVSGLVTWFRGFGVDLSSGNLLLVVLLGLAASISSCMALVGGLVLSLSARFTQHHPDAGAIARLRPQALFNLGRIVGFSLLGGVLGAVGTVFMLRGMVLAVAMLLVSLVMGFLGLKLTGVSPRLDGFSLTLPSALTAWLPDRAGGAYRDREPLLLGAASFFLPCGFTQAVQVYALSSGSPLRAGLIMGLFALGTTPGLMGVGAVASFIKGPRAPRILRVVGVVVIGFALINLSGALTAIGAGLGLGVVTAQPAGAMVEGAQELRTTVNGNGYIPANATVNAGQPIRWTLDLTAISCASIINTNALGAGVIRLNQGENVINISALKPGTYRYTCAMGMYQGTITAR